MVFVIFFGGGVGQIFFGGGQLAPGFQVSVTTYLNYSIRATFTLYAKSSMNGLVKRVSVRSAYFQKVLLLTCMLKNVYAKLVEEVTCINV